MTADADVFDKKFEEVTLGGKTVTVKPLPVGKIPKVLRIVQPVMSSIQAEFNVIDLIGNHGETLIDLAVIVTALEKEEVEDLALDEFILLVETVLRVNADFFSQKVLPAMNRISESLTSAKG